MIIKGVNPLPAYGREGQEQQSLAAYFAKRNTKNCGAKKGEATIAQNPNFENWRKG